MKRRRPDPAPPLSAYPEQVRREINHLRLFEELAAQRYAEKDREAIRLAVARQAAIAMIRALAPGALRRVQEVGA